MTSRFLSALLAAAIAAPAPAQVPGGAWQKVVQRVPVTNLTAAEQTMLQTVDREQPRTIAFLQRMVDQNSGTMNLAGVAAVRDLVEPEFRQLGFKTEWIDMKEAGRAGHFVARHVGSKRGKRLLLIAHLDTVFEPDSPFQRWQQDGDRAHGPGAGDDKGGIAVIVAALRAMQAAGTLKQANITVFLTGDEEDAGNPLTVSRRDLIAEGKRADVALDFEDLAVDDGPDGKPADFGSIARRSAGSWTVRVTGRSAHSAGVGANNYGAIYELARILDAFRRELPEDKLTYNVGLVAGGQTATLDAGRIRIDATGKTNIIAATAVARGDLRALSEEQINRTRAKMRAIVGQSLTGTKAEINFDEDSYPPMPPTEGNRELLAKLNGVNRDMGLPEMGELDPAKRGAGDISFVAKDVDGLVGLGPASDGSHTAAEVVDLPSIPKQAKRAALLMSRLAKEPRARRP
jgi:glutamate carboxypeptidase